MKNKNLIHIFLVTLSLLVQVSSAYAGPFDTCDYEIKIKDGRYGYVWKPSGAHREEAVLVLPGRFKGFIVNTSTLVVRSATLYRADTLTKIGTMPMKSNGLCAPGGECLDRPTFAHPKYSGKQLSRRYGQIRIRIMSNVHKHVHCTKAFDPKDRQD